MIGITVKSLSLVAGTIIFLASFGSAGAADAEVALSIDASKTGAPISKYIYGQFAEHLGRSIYGGLWAEMIEDRKFGQEITDDYKPFDVAEDNYGKPGRSFILRIWRRKLTAPRARV